MKPRAPELQTQVQPFTSQCYKCGAPVSSCTAQSSLGAVWQLVAHVPWKAEICDGLGPTQSCIQWSRWDEDSSLSNLRTVALGAERRAQRMGCNLEC